MTALNIVLFAPEIPGNTGSIGRTCLALGAKLHLIRPYGFDLSEKAVRRAGLDYWKHVDITEYEDWDHFIETRSAENLNRLFFLSKFADKTIYETKIEPDSFLIFGSETKGLPKFIHDQYSQNLFKLPMQSSHVRSLNLSCAATAVAYEAYRQIHLL